MKWLSFCLLSLLLAEHAGYGRLSTGCEPGSMEDWFTEKMVGCSGNVTFSNRSTLCGPGWIACPAREWVAHFGGRKPNANYWTDTSLKYDGTDGACSVSETTGHDCGTYEPMRICAAKTDTFGNVCNWTGCGYESTVNVYFGGCVGNGTAGTLCCQP